MLMSVRVALEFLDDKTRSGVVPYILMFGVVLLLTLLGALMVFAPTVLLRFSRWKRQKMSVPLGALENISEIESQSSWRRRQLVPGLFALGFGLFLLHILLRSLLSH
jgi:hypothetical protein